MRRKYKMTKETMVVDGHVLHRIMALKNFGIVKAGDLGGWIEKKENLSQTGECWVYNNAKVYEDAKICDDAHIYNNAKIYGTAIVREYAHISGNANIYGYATIFNNARVYDDAHIHGNAYIYGNATVRKNANILGTAEITSHMLIESDADISITENILFTLEISNGRPDFITFYKSKCGNIMVSGLGFNDTIDKFEKYIETYNDLYRNHYLDIIKFARNVVKMERKIIYI